MQKKTVIVDVEFAPGSRVITISDIHAHPDRLRQVLALADYRPGEDHLVIIGDLIEKGPDNLGSLREVMRLAAASPRVHVLMGNVDRWRALSMLEPTAENDEAFRRNIAHNERYWGSTIFTDMCRAAGLNYGTLAEFSAAREAIREIYADELDFLATRPTILRTPRYLFVHGGLPCSEDAIETLTAQSANICLKYDNFLADLDARREPPFARTVIVGHWPVSLNSDRIYAFMPHYSAAHNVLSIDGGCGIKREGQLNALLLDADSGRYDWVAADGLSTVRALDAQAASSDPICIGWGDNEVRRTDASAPTGYVEIEHLRTGRRLYVPDDYLYEDGELYVEDCTDYALPVEAGDELRLVRVMPDAILAKKDGIVGWYRGGYTS